MTVKARTVQATSVSIVQGERVSLKKGTSTTLKANIAPSNTVDNSVTWISSDPNIVSVDSNGKITAKKSGSATITVKTTNGKTDKITVDVTGASKAYPDAEVTTSSTGNGFGKPKKIVVHKQNKSGDPRCGSHSGDYCVGTADVTYANGKKITFYMGNQTNYGVQSGACRAHAFTAAYNATSNKKISTKKTIDLAIEKNPSHRGNPFRGKKTINYVANRLNANVKTYFGDTSSSKTKQLAREALNNGQPIVLFVSGNSSIAAGYPLSGKDNAHALLLLGENSKGKIEFLDSSNRFRTWTGKLTLDQLFNVMVGTNTANSWMRLFVFSY